MGAKMRAKMQAKRIAWVMSMLVATIFIASYAIADTMIEYTYDAAGNPTSVVVQSDGNGD